MSDSRLPELTMSAWLRFDAIRRFLRIANPARVLEVGAGQGGLGSWIARHYDYVGFEPDQASRAVAASRVAGHTRGRITDSLAPYVGERFDAVCAFEVLEHIDDDGAAIDEWRGYVADAGHLVVSVPAHEARFGPSDEFVGHFRRYERDGLTSLLREHGFAVERFVSYGAGLGQALDAGRNVVLRRKAAPDERQERTAGSGRLFQPSRAIAGVATYSLAAPFRLVQKPFESSDTGIGYVVLARRT